MAETKKTPSFHPPISGGTGCKGMTPGNGQPDGVAVASLAVKNREQIRHRNGPENKRLLVLICVDHPKAI
jgi:hypothetical protein